MLGMTHFMGGALAGLLAAHATGHTGTVGQIMAGVAACAALLPDIDSPHSMVGRVLLPVSLLLDSTVGHRNLTHSALAVAAAGAVTLLLPGVKAYYALAVAAGFLSHILLDMLNPEGVPLLYPHPARWRVPLFTTGGIFDRLLGGALFAAFVYLAVKLRVF